MADFDGFGELADHFFAAERKLGPAVVHELDAMGRAVTAAVKAKFGTYGPGWAVLTPATQQERARQGYTPNDPLFRAGTLQGLVTHSVDGDSVTIGIPDGAKLKEPYAKKAVDAQKVMDALEMGTTDGRIKPRPVFGQVFFVADRFADAFVIGVLGRIDL